MASTSAKQLRPHSGRSHSHSHDNSYLLSTNRSDAGVRITRIGLYVNLGMAIVKGIGGYVFNSKALLADAVHSLTDLVSDFMTLATVSLALKPPSERFPNGYGKVESLGSLGVSGMLLFGGCMMGYSALLGLGGQFIPGFTAMAAELGAHVHSHDHGVVDLGPNINAAWLAGGSILIKEWLYRATLKIAKERKSSVLASNAYHHRVDSLTAFVALLTIAGSNVLQNAAWMDPVGGLVISLMVIQAGLGNTRSSVLELADVGMDGDMKRKIRRAAMRALDEDDADANADASANTRGQANGSLSNQAGKVEVRQIHGIKAGQSYLVDVELGVPASWTIDQTQHVERIVRARVGAKVRGVKKVGFRFVPVDAGEPDFTDEFIAAEASPRSSPEPEPEDDNGHDHDHDHDKHGNKHPHSK